MSPKDPLRPWSQPAQRFYDAFQKASQREPRDFEAEERAVWQEVCDYVQENGLRVPTLEEVQQAALYTQGHVDFGSKWAYALRDLIENG